MNSGNLKEFSSSLEDINSESDWDTDDEMDKIVEAVLSSSSTNSVNPFNPKTDSVQEPEAKNLANSKNRDGVTDDLNETTELRNMTIGLRNGTPKQSTKGEVSTVAIQVTSGTRDENVDKGRTVMQSACRKIESVDLVDGSVGSCSKNVRSKVAFANYSSIYQEGAFLYPPLSSPKMYRGLEMETMITTIKNRNWKLSSRRYTRLLSFVDACLFGKVEIVVYMIYKEYINVNDELICCLNGLQHACYAGQYEVVKILLELGAKPNYKRKLDRFTAVMAGCCYSGNETENLVRCVKAIVAAGGKIDVVQASGMTALLYAVQRSHIKIVEYLLDKGADIEHKNSEGHGAIFFAKENKDSQMLALLGRHQWTQPTD